VSRCITHDTLMTLATATQSLVALLEQAEKTRDAALAEQQRLRNEAAAAHAQHEQLVGYRRDYEARYNAQFASAGSMEMLRCYQSFMQRLTQAVDQQARVAQHADQRAAAAQEAVQQLEIRVASIRKLIERRAEEHQRVLAQRERRESDELAARSAGGGGAMPGNALYASIRGFH
jgi:flagellar FliJ protein